MFSSQVKYETMNTSGNSSQHSHYEVLLAYNINQPTEPKAWDSKAYSISIFGFIEFLEIGTKTCTSLCYAW